MSIRNFKPSVIGKDFTASLKAQPSLLKLTEWLIKELFETKNTQLIFNVFFAHFVENGKPVEPNYTLGQLVSTVDVGSIQEFMSDTRLRELMFGDMGLFKTYKLLVPITISKVDGEDRNDNGRHRSASFGFLGYALAIGLKQMGMPSEEAVALIDSQAVWVQRLDYDVTNAVVPVFTSTRKGKDTVYSLTILDDDSSEEHEKLQNQLTAQFVIQANSSRKPQKGEIEGVELGALGVNIKKPASVINGFRKGAIDKFKLFRFLSQAELYVFGEGYELCLLNSFRMQQYKPYSPITLQKLFDGVAKSLWAHAGGGADKCHPFRSLLTGCENAMPKYSKEKGWNTPAPRPDKCNNVALLSFVKAFWEPQSLEAWQETVEGYRFEKLDLLVGKLEEASTKQGLEFGLPELSLVELAWQLYHLADGAETINLDKALSKSKDKITFFTVFEQLLNQWDVNLEASESNFYEYFEVFAQDEEEEDEVEEDELEEAQSYMSMSLFDEEL